MLGDRWRARAASLLLVAVGAAGCGPGAQVTASPQPRDGRAGIQATGRLDSAGVVVSDGAPELVVGDCDPGDGPDRDVCGIASDVNGQLFVVVVENPDVLAAGEPVPVGDPGCTRGCDDVTDVAVVDLQVGVGERLRATGGRLTPTVVEPFARYAGSAHLELRAGEVTVDFDLVPLPER